MAFAHASLHQPVDRGCVHLPPAPIPATYVVRWRLGNGVTAERRYDARVLGIHGEQLDIEYVGDDGTIRTGEVPAANVEVHP